MRNRKPTYDLDEIQEIALDMRKCKTSTKVSHWLDNHGYPPAETVHNIILSLREEDFYETTELIHNPGVMADVYKPTFSDEDWYVKFFKEETGKIQIRVWSCWHDGAIH